MPVIRQLPPSVVNKIAAGEVIERPASVLKELLENALDAGATRVDVALAKGGMDLVRVADNGHGISAEQLPLAVAPHATSKLVDAEDLFRVQTLGFRGEALASIGEVSRLVLRSREAETAGGHELAIAGGLAQPTAPCGCPVGTSVEVRDLFYNTPVRRKFFRSVATELGHATEAFTRMALAYPQVHFSLRHNDKLVYDLAPADPWLERIAQFFGRELADQLLWVESRDEAACLYGYAALPSQHRANQRMQYLFLNGRHIRDRSLQHALGEAYRGLLLTGRHPVAFLCLTLPPDQVDVNVHPTKLEVRFQDSGRLYSQLLGTLRTRFLTSDLTARLDPQRAKEPLAAARRATDGVARVEAVVEQPLETAGHELVHWAQQQLAAWDRDDAVAPPLRLNDDLPRATGATAPADADWWSSQRGSLSLHPAPPAQRPWPAAPAHAAAQGMPAFAPPSDEPAATRATFPAVASGAANASRPDLGPAGNAGFDRAGPAPASARAPRGPAALQVHNRYLIAESPEGVVVIDQHALHERILYEQLRAKVLSGNFETQHLLVPVPVDLAPSERAAALDNLELLARLGLHVEPFGGDTLLVHSHPAMLIGVEPAELLRSVVEPLVAGSRQPDRRDVLDELLHMMSCKAAVKAGDPLSEAEVAALVAQRHLVHDAHHCPHGRPTVLVFTREELDKQFQRT